MGGMEQTYQFLADVVLSLHVSFVAFVVVGLLVIMVGGFRQWQWIRNSWFRMIHLIGISIVMVQSWLGAICPLTSLEMSLREQAGQAHYDGSFIQYWFQRLLYYDAPLWAFATTYTVFGLVVAFAWIRFPPKVFGNRVGA